MARTKSTARLAADVDPAVRRRLEIMAARARRVRPRRANRTPNSPVHVPTTVVDTVFTEGVSPTRKGKVGRGEPPEVRGGTGTGVSGATANEPPKFPRPTAIAGPSGTKRKKKYSGGSQQLGEAWLVDHREDVFRGTPIRGPHAAY